MTSSQQSLFFASSNHGKIQEFKDIFAVQLPQYQILSLSDFPDLTQEVEETGSTYQQNALLKAEAYSRLTDLPLVTDDSGVEVVAFPNIMGVHSARWLPGTNADRVNALLQKLSTVTDRTLIYHSVLCYLAPGQAPRFFSGKLRGHAAEQPIGASGFGYDPIMIPDGYDLTLAQLGSNIKNQISHRRRAINQLSEYLQQQNWY